MRNQIAMYGWKQKPDAVVIRKKEEKEKHKEKIRKEDASRFEKMCLIFLVTQKCQNNAGKFWRNCCMHCGNC